MWRHTKRQVTKIYSAIRHGFETDSCDWLQSSDKYSSQWKVEHMGGHWADRSRIQGQFRSRIHFFRDHRTRAAGLHIQGDKLIKWRTPTLNTMFSRRTQLPLPRPGTTRSTGSSWWPPIHPAVVVSYSMLTRWHFQRFRFSPVSSSSSLFSFQLYHCPLRWRVRLLW